jgi:hypothetical protein
VLNEQFPPTKKEWISKHLLKICFHKTASDRRKEHVEFESTYPVLKVAARKLQSD